MGTGGGVSSTGSSENQPDKLLISLLILSPLLLGAHSSFGCLYFLGSCACGFLPVCQPNPMCLLAFRNCEQRKSLVTPKCNHFPFSIWLCSGEIRSGPDRRACLNCITNSIHFLANSWVEGVFVSMEMRGPAKERGKGEAGKK